MSAIQQYKEDAKKLAERVKELEAEIVKMRKIYEEEELLKCSLIALYLCDVADHANNEALVRRIPKMRDWLDNKRGLKIVYNDAIRTLEKEANQ